MIGVIVFGIIMFVAFIGMLFCAKVQRSQPRAQLYAIALLVIILFCGSYIMFSTMTPERYDMTNELKYARAAAVILGQELGTRYSGMKTLIIVQQNYQNNKRQQEQIQGLREGFGNRISDIVIDYPQHKVSDIVDPVMMDILTAEGVDKVIRKNHGCELIVSLIGLPHDVGNMEIWQLPVKKRPKFALLNGDVYGMKRGISKGLINAVVSYRPGIRITETPAPDKPIDAFDKRYLLVTENNIHDIANKYPDLFMK